MTHAFRTAGNLHGHGHSVNPGDLGKLGLVVLAGVGIGFEIIHSPLLKDDSKPAPPAVVLQTNLNSEPSVILRLDNVASLLTLGASPAIEAVQPSVSELPQITAREAAPPAPEPALVPQQITQVAPVTDIHGVDFANLPLLQNLARQLSGRVDNSLVRYADLTGDGNAEAIVPITSDGTYGNLAFVVLTEKAGTPTAILTRLAGRERRGLAFSFDRGQISETSGIYGPNDPNSTPHQLVRTYFRWDGQTLVLDRTDTINIPNDKTAD